MKGDPPYKGVGMVSVPQELRRRLKESGQEHVLAWWDKLADPERKSLLQQLQALDLKELQSLYANRDQSFPLPPPKRIQPVPDLSVSAEENARHRSLGEEAFRQGQVAFLIVAGGQGSRLGFEKPKGMFPVGPVSEKTLFQLHAEKVLALERRFSRLIPFLIMTSPATHEDTLAFFEQERYFGLTKEEVFFFTQGTMPALDLATGRLLLEAPGRLFTSPNGHGGTLTGLAESGLLDRLKSRGIKVISYFQVDNPLVKLADFAFVGQHLAKRAEVSSKALPKQTPTDKVGNFVVVDGRCTIIEYSDLPDELAHQTDAQGRLRIWAGNTAIHLFDVDFLKRVTQGESRIPWHVARKKVPYLNDRGELVQPAKENALKFEMFIFDVLPRAERWTLVPTNSPEEFEPLKNASGPNSPETVRQAISNLAADWLERAGVKVPRRDSGELMFPLEISPLYALAVEELERKVDRGLRIEGPMYLQ
jgi:UDP-N-acetylglucosamine/UDP-N-acetylgalactosamine diphosphorylase